METTMNSRWATPAVAMVLAVLMFAAFAIGGQPLIGLGALAVMAVYGGVLFVLGSRSETIGVLAGRPADERLAGFNMLATAVAGTVAVVVAIAGFLWATARGESGYDFALVAAAGGIGYLAAIMWLRWRG